MIPGLTCIHVERYVKRLLTPGRLGMKIRWFDILDTLNAGMEGWEELVDYYGDTYGNLPFLTAFYQFYRPQDLTRIVDTLEYQFSISPSDILRERVPKAHVDLHQALWRDFKVDHKYRLHRVQWSHEEGPWWRFEQRFLPLEPGDEKYWRSCEQAIADFNVMRGDTPEEELRWEEVDVVADHLGLSGFIAGFNIASAYTAMMFYTFKWGYDFPIPLPERKDRSESVPLTAF